MNAFQDEKGEKVDISLTAEEIDVDSETNCENESISRMLNAYRQCMNTSDTQSESSDDDLVVNDADFDEFFEKSSRNRTRLDTLKQKYNDIKEGNVQFDNNFDKSFADLPYVKPENDVDFSSMSVKEFSDYLFLLEASVKKKEEENPSLIAENMKNQLDQVNAFVEDVVNKVSNLELKEKVTDNTRLMNILNLSKSVVNTMKSIETKVHKANELITTLKLYTDLKEKEGKK